MQLVLRLPENTKGRDFVVGDIHGAYDLVLRAMKQARFNPAVDRLFSVGDLIDRGEESYRCAAFLSLPFVVAVRGNHEDMLLALYQDGEPPPEAIDWMVRRNGLGWWLKVKPEQRRVILDAIRKLPLACEIATARGTVGLIHADVPSGMDWNTFLGQIKAGDSKTIETCLWGRSRLTHGDEAGVRGVGRLFVGHTPQWKGLTRLGNVYAVDSGAIFGLQGQEVGHLTMTNLLTGTQVLAGPPAVTDLVDVRDGAIPERLFGRYAA